SSATPLSTSISAPCTSIFNKSIRSTPSSLITSDSRRSRHQRVSPLNRSLITSPLSASHRSTSALASSSCSFSSLRRITSCSYSPSAYSLLPLCIVCPRYTVYRGQTMQSGKSEYADGEYEQEVIRRRLENEQEEEASAEVERWLAESGEVMSERFRGETRWCRERRLSEVIREEGVERIDLLKIDVQGAEIEVLRGVAEEGGGKI